MYLTVPGDQELCDDFLTFEIKFRRVVERAMRETSRWIGDKFHALAATVFKVAAKGLPGVVKPFLIEATHVVRKLPGKKREIIRLVRVQLERFGKLLDEVRAGGAAAVVFDIVEVLWRDRHAIVALHTCGKLFLTEPELFSLVHNHAAEGGLRCDVVTFRNEM
jgi:hypothetical protein